MDKNTLWGPTRICVGPSSVCHILNDIDDYVGSRILKFADDTKIYNKVNSVEDIENYEQTLVN